MKNVTKTLDKLIAKEETRLKTSKELKKQGLKYCSDCKVWYSNDRVHKRFNHK